jgi:glucose-1-phosphate thymidylyltransferase
LKGEYFLADAINIMLENDACHMRTQKVSIWLDAGTFEAMLSTNRYLLEHGHDNSEKASQRMGVSVIPPVFIHPESEVEASVIGPHATVEAGCRVVGCRIENSIIEHGSRLEEVILEGSLIGQNTTLRGKSKSINIGDNTEVEI